MKDQKGPPPTPEYEAVQKELEEVEASMAKHCQEVAQKQDAIADRNPEVQLAVSTLAKLEATIVESSLQFAEEEARLKDRRTEFEMAADEGKSRQNKLEAMHAREASIRLGRVANTDKLNDATLVVANARKHAAGESAAPTEQPVTQKAALQNLMTS